MAFDKKTWANNQGGGTPLDASGLNDLESRITDSIDELDVDLDSHKAESTQHEAVLVNGFTGSIRYRKNKHNIVHLMLSIDGLTTNTYATVVCTLPAGFRPASEVVIPINGSNNAPYTARNSFYIHYTGAVRLTFNNGLTVQEKTAGIIGEVSYYGGA